MGTSDGSIIGTIITTHMATNEAAKPGHVCPGIRIHAIDIDQPPGIGISPIADIDVHQTIVTAAPTTNTSAQTAKKARCHTRRRARATGMSSRGLGVVGERTCASRPILIHPPWVPADRFVRHACVWFGNDGDAARYT
jgi:hypothetical protein